MQHGLELSAGIREGDILAGKYRVERVLGVGGMGVVVAASHVQLETKVAIKFLLPEMLSSREAVARFAREARAAVRITSEHVARIFDVGTLENGAPYMVMEFLEGGDLAAWIEQRGPMPVEQAVEFVLQACVAVADAHGLGIVHRDLKPANLFCVRRTDGRLLIKVLDFGISKVTQFGSSGPGTSATKTSALMGSPLYMSPEQMQSAKAVDSATDLWALGIILFELLSGKTPFLGETLPEVVLNIATKPPPSLRALRPDVPPALEAIVLRCLQKEPRARYRNVGELAVALLAFAPRAQASVDRISGIMQTSGLSATALEDPPSPRLVTPSTAGAETAAPVGQTLARPKGVKTGVIVAVVLGALAFGAVAGIMVFSSRPASSQVDPKAATSALAAAASPPPPATAAPAPASTGPAPTETQKDVPASPPPEPPPPAVAGPRTAPPTTTPSVAPPAVQHAKNRTVVVAPPAAAVAPSGPAKNCDPPYYYDANRNRVFKKECM
jgi:serine/threonine protein kinase